VVADPQGSTLLIPKPATGHDPEPLPLFSDPHNLSLQDPSECYPPSSFSVCQGNISQEVSPSKFCVHSLSSLVPRILLRFTVLTSLGDLHITRSSSLCTSPNCTVASSLLSSIFLTTLFSDIYISCSSLKVRDHVSHPYKTTDKIIILYILNFNVLKTGNIDNCFTTRISWGSE